MFVDEIRKFDKEVLVQFIYTVSMFESEKSLRRLEHQKKCLRFKKLFAKSLILVKQMREESDEAESIKLHLKNQRILRSMNKILLN